MNDADLLRELENLVPREQWTEADLANLGLIARDLAGLAEKLATTTDTERRKHYQRRVDLLVSHVVVLAYSRLNVGAKSVQAALERLLEIVARSLIAAFVAR